MKQVLIIIATAHFSLSTVAAQSWAEGSSTQTTSSLDLQAESAKDAKLAIAWESTSENLGKVTQNEPVTVIFNFTNSGDAPITIENVKPSCGCTAADYTKGAIAPGKTGYVKATYNAKAAGFFNKAITVRSNAGIERLFIKGEVVAGE